MPCLPAMTANGNHTAYVVITGGWFIVVSPTLTDPQIEDFLARVNHSTYFQWDDPPSGFVSGFTTLG